MLESASSVQRVAVLVDYENMNRRARSLFGGSGPRDIPPRLLAETVIARRTNKGFRCELVKVLVFRGRPGEGQPGRARFCVRDAEWKKDPLIETHYIELHYSRGTAREKGVDVALALGAARVASSGEIDVVVIASEDSDLAPAVAHTKTGGVRVETVVWDNLQGSAKGALKRAWEQQPRGLAGGTGQNPRHGSGLEDLHQTRRHLHWAEPGRRCGPSKRLGVLLSLGAWGPGRGGPCRFRGEGDHPRRVESRAQFVA
ncbi:NYN domain-containing protein [Sinomonas sp. G460-2]|uniref:NYN domain-containing protein n=1 Tax=Sinomonas sp. G460-2 TaxID=3393464 RepID=UPI0039EFDBE8